MWNIHLCYTASITRFFRPHLYQEGPYLLLLTGRTRVRLATSPLYEISSGLRAQGLTLSCLPKMVRNAMMIMRYMLVRSGVRPLQYGHSPDTRPSRSLNALLPSSGGPGRNLTMAFNSKFEFTLSTTAILIGLVDPGIMDPIRPVQCSDLRRCAQCTGLLWTWRLFIGIYLYILSPSVMRPTSFGL